MYCRNLLVMALMLLSVVWAAADETTVPDGKIAAWSAFYDLDPSVQYDQRIFQSYFRDGRWTEPELAPFAQEYLCASFTHDGNYLFYTANRDIYWVDARVLDQVR